MGADAALSNDVSTLQSDLSAETSARIGADGALSNSVSTANTLRMGADAALSNDVSTLQSDKLEASTWQNAASTTNYYARTGGTVSGTVTINSGSSSDLVIDSAGTNITIGKSALGGNGGVVVGSGAEGAWLGTAVGNSALGSYDGAAVGYRADASFEGVAVGRDSMANYYGVAIGYRAEAMGNMFGEKRVAIGHGVTNNMDPDTAVIRGTLFLDGGTGVYYRSSFGSGSWTALPTRDTEITYTVPYSICSGNPQSSWTNNTSASDWEWNWFATAVDGTDHSTNGVIDVKLRIYGQSDNGSDFYVGLRNHTVTNFAIAHAQTGLGDAGWWETGWSTVTNTSLNEYRVSAYTANGANYYYIKRAWLLVRYRRALRD
jgi:hypothetical protein